MNFVYKMLRAGLTQADSDTGAEVATKINENFKNVADKFKEIEKTLGSGTVQEVIIGGESQTIENGKLEIPIGGDNQAGIVKSSDTKNKIGISDDGTMEVVSLDVDKLVQEEGAVLILDGNY